MFTMKHRALGAALAVLAVASSALAQGSLRERVHFTINVPAAMKMGDYMLPAGKYLLRQVSATDPNLFALHRGDDTDTPIATLRTTRVDYKPGEYPKDAKIRLEVDEAPGVAHPTLRGWTIPGQDGWEIIAVDADDDEFLVRIP